LKAVFDGGIPCACIVAYIALRLEIGCFKGKLASHDA
jgi:hypothetical protein